MNIEIIAKNLVRLRKLNKWTQSGIAEKLNVSRQAISKWETGSSLPNIEVLLSLSKLYEISMNEILEPSNHLKLPSFEEIVNIDEQIINTVIPVVNRKKFLIAAKGASPSVFKFLNEILDTVNFEEEFRILGSVSVLEIENYQREILETINYQILKSTKENDL